MNKASDVIVIGAGVVGCAAAYYLAKRGVKVTVLERREVACGASGRNGSGARQSGRDNRELPLAMFGVKHIWPTLGEELGEDIEYIQNGNMRLGKTEKDREALEELVRQNSSLGLDVRMVYGQDIRELIPDVSPEVQYATYCPTDGHANPMRTTLALYKRARELGAQFITNIKVLKLEKVAGRIRRVHTDDGIYEADSVILCAGFGSRKIMRTVGLDVPMLPQLTEAFVTEPIPAVTDKFISAADGCFYAQQQRNGTWVIGGDSNYEIYDATYPREVTFSFSAPRIARFFLEYMPTLKGVKVIRSWSGQLDMCWDGYPVISPVEEVEGLYVGCAFTGHGFGIGPAAGYVLAQMAVGEAPAVDLSGLRYDRFRLPSH